ncbi:MAG: KpsF/GutQ family sugar-phosphate isomerase [Gammaproteobacteria bacterium]|nr:KpsF/GutQ family sugar-phosphate isomerase [Gammaproteobacteria bacterium]MDD9816127.1 KpsF/GutQ family sugar-phosphate isomerase [Gammaproteobacteria bacterium]MDD9851282.1 KpsF/GutQ family sugar-phosphate isomerase [Gammaproteobacteria bacterium]
MNRTSYQEHARTVIRLEAEALGALVPRIDETFDAACGMITAAAGRVVVTGMGKSGHIGGKIASTLASTGTPAFFVHPGEAGHGDLGMITADDLVLALSNSGETPELLTLLPIVKRMGVKLIALCGAPGSTLARAADVALDASVAREACPLNLAPTASTAAALALGDALAVALFKARGFNAEDFARAHPGGALGRRLLLYVRDIMHTGDAVPLAKAGDKLGAVLPVMNGSGLGMVGVTGEGGKLIGIFTDGDLRRALGNGVDVYSCPLGDVMTRNPRTVGGDVLAAEIIQRMRDESINGLFVVDAAGRVTGAFNTHDLLRAGVW